jgi:large subunit ribosomal protein L15
VSTSIRIGSLRPAAGATHAKKRRGKGAATGLGGTAGKGHKGHKARAGGTIPAWFEGGQMPVQRRLPKRGFKNPTRVEYEVVNVGRLATATAGTTVDRAWLESNRIVRRPGPIKLLGNGELKTALTVKVEAASEKARQAIEGAGGKLELLRPKAEADGAAAKPRPAKAKAAQPLAPATKAKTQKAPAPEPPAEER